MIIFHEKVNVIHVGCEGLVEQGSVRGRLACAGRSCGFGLGF